MCFIGKSCLTDKGEDEEEQEKKMEKEEKKKKKVGTCNTTEIEKNDFWSRSLEQNTELEKSSRHSPDLD